MSKTIVVMGATGNLGGKIVDALLARGADVRAIVRPQTDQNKINGLVKKGVKVHQADTGSRAEVAKCCIGADCVVSALAGLRETIIDTQKTLLEAAVEAKVPRFIPSDYSSDFTPLAEGQNRNLDLRREFHRYLDQAPIRATSIFNGPFMELLTTDMPLIMFKQKRILCWGSPEQIIEFTTTYDVAAYTAEAAMDHSAPRYLHIAGDRLCCHDFVKLLTALTGTPYKLFRPGGIGLLNLVIRLTRFFSPSGAELYPAWQGMQYMRDMMEGRTIPQKYDNDRYPDIKWTTVSAFLTREKAGVK